MDEDEQLAHAINMSLTGTQPGRTDDNEEDDSVIYLSDTDLPAQVRHSRTVQTTARETDDVIDLTSDLSDDISPEVDTTYTSNSDAFFEPEMDAELNFAMKLSKEAEELEQRVRKSRPQTEEEEAQALRIAIQASLIENRTRSEKPESSNLKRPRRSSSVFETSSSPSRADCSASDVDDSRLLSQRKREEQEERRRAVLIARSKKRGSFGELTPASVTTPHAASTSMAKDSLFYSDPDDEQEEAGRREDAISLVSNPQLTVRAIPLVGAQKALERTSSTSFEGRNKDEASSKPRTNPQSLSIPSRAQMEAERLARAQARQSSSSGFNSSPKPVPYEVHPPTPAPKSTSNYIISATATSFEAPRKKPRVDPALQATIQQRSGELYWQGVLGVTPNVYAKEAKGKSKVFSPNDVIGDKNQIAFSILSTYCFDPNFLPDHFPHPSEAPIILVSPPPAVELAGKSSYDQLIEGVWSCFPYLPKSFSPNFGLFMGACHMKLFYKDGRMRTVITSANFMGFDWESIENGVWMQDFMPLPDGPPQDTDRSDFGQQWEFVLQSLGVDKTLDMMSKMHLKIPITQLSHIHRYNFGKVTIRLVASVRGTRTGWNEVEKAGVARLGKIIREERWIARDEYKLPCLEAQGSSVAAATPRWLTDFWRLSDGLDPRDWLVARSTIKTYPPIKITSLATVKASEMSTQGGGTMFFTRKNWVPGIQPLFHDANSKRARVMMHIKMLLAVFEKVPQRLSSSVSTNRPSSMNDKRSVAASAALSRHVKQKIDVIEESETEDEDEGEDVGSIKQTGKTLRQVGGWMYMGSHNFTQSAWGNLSMKKDVGPSMSLMNYELGIVFPLPLEKAEETASALATWKRPPRKYLPSDIPWIQSEADM
ncbi:Tyrosyl-DNA phosphodiesterase [Phaffia rhodozyma]|uniref:Tyrosyl-DNA phosphodiesterase n=1 Tax=Phaffia rhodozyma TaxID=264483 RepID=A0A0F7SMN2_PHARH|nr:Tyrosyl-DNA phosphodiesterase [Phaffia rhodozyma]